MFRTPFGLSGVIVSSSIIRRAVAPSRVGELGRRGRDISPRARGRRVARRGRVRGGLSSGRVQGRSSSGRGQGAAPRDRGRDVSPRGRGVVPKGQRVASSSQGVTSSTQEASSSSRQEVKPCHLYPEMFHPESITYCLCKKVQDAPGFTGKMINCENGLCLIKWFHFECVDITVAPQGTWYCPNCRGSTSSVLKWVPQLMQEINDAIQESERNWVEETIRRRPEMRSVFYKN